MENNNAEILFVLGCLEGSKPYSALPKFLKDEIAMYLEKIGGPSMRIEEAIIYLKSQMKY